LGIGISGEIGEACVLDIDEMLRETSNDILIERLEVVAQGVVTASKAVFRAPLSDVREISKDKN
jgi:hypothetical protein